jgi:hypothetical protein
MLIAVTFLLLPQRLDPPPQVTHPDEPVVVRAIDRSGTPVARIHVAVKTPAGKLEDAGVADENGEVRFTPVEVGKHEFRAQFPGGPLVIVVHDVVAKPRRWLYALILTPIGLLLIWWNLTKFRRQR